MNINKIDYIERNLPSDDTSFMFLEARRSIYDRKLS